MAKKKYTDDPTILEAVDNLSSMAEINLDEISEDKKDPSAKIPISGSRWLDLKDEKKTYESVKSTFKVVHNYLQHVYKKEPKQLKDKSMQKGVASIMALANEAAQKIDSYSKFFKGAHSVSESPEYQELIDFYQNKIQKRFQTVLESEEEWEEEWGKEEDAADIQRRGLKDLETVTRDKDYELFYVTKEDGARFFNKNLVRHIRLVADFDQIIGGIAGEDPLIQIKKIQDKEACFIANAVKQRSKKTLDHWIKTAGKHREDSFIQGLFRSVMALLLAANPQNLLIHKAGKSCLGYFQDFQINLRFTLSSVDYQRFIENPIEEDQAFFLLTLELLHEICAKTFTTELHRDEAHALFIRTIGREKIPKQRSKTSSIALWNRLLDDHEKLGKELKHFPSGPLFKVLDILSNPDEIDDFDPYMQGDLGMSLYQIELPKHVMVHRLPCPTIQHTIQKAHMVPEFLGVLRDFAKQEKKLLVVNMQDRTSWKEFARSHLLETIQRDAEFRTCLNVVTFPKNTDFYAQGEDYLKLHDAKEFQKLFFEQIKSEEECGFYFPRPISREELHKFTEKALATVHEVFFGNKETLSRKNRLDFIEIIYHLLAIKLLEMLKASDLAFTAKDGADVAAISSGSFYAFIKLLMGDIEWKAEESDFLEEMLFIPALLYRERSVDAGVLSRHVSMLSVVTGEVELSKATIQSKLGKLLAIDLDKALQIKKEMS